MNKIKTLLKAPVLTQSGYGVHSRQIFQALIHDPLFDVCVEPINWGNTPFLTEDTPLKSKIKECVRKFIVNERNNNKDYDLFVHVTIPNEFERKGKYCVGVTAGIETDRVSHVWLQKCNEMDLIVVPSEHAKKGLTDTRVMVQYPNGQSGEIKLEKPIEVCPEGFADVFKKWQTEDDILACAKPLYDKLNIESEFNLLCVGQWGPGGLGEDRKNIGLTVKWFLETFEESDGVGLVLKTNIGRNSIVDYERVSHKIAEIKSQVKKDKLPPVYLLHGNLTDEEMSALYNHPKIKGFVTFTHGEGFGLPLLEAAACGLPVIAPGWSGHTDFLSLGKYLCVEHELQPIPDSIIWENILVKGSQWAYAKEDRAKHRMRKFASSPLVPQEWASDLAQKVKEKYNLQAVCNYFSTTLKQKLLGSEAGKQHDPVEYLSSLIDTTDCYNVLYTMPMSMGDVFISTAVIDGLKKELPQNSKIYFATQTQLYGEVLKNNPNIHKVIQWDGSMMSTDLTEKVFDLVLTPNVGTQLNIANWVRRGQGRLLAEEFANHCLCELGDYFIDIDEKVCEDHLKDKNYMTLHVGAGKNQWSSRKYVEWFEIVKNIKNYVPNLTIVQIGAADDEEIGGVDVDLRGKTSPGQMAGVLKNSMLHLGIDSFPMHVCAMTGTPLVALFGGSYAKSTGPWYKEPKKAKFALIETDDRLGCEKACYKHECQKNKEMPCINSIDPVNVFKYCMGILKSNG